MKVEKVSVDIHHHLWYYYHTFMITKHDVWIFFHSLLQHTPSKESQSFIQYEQYVMSETQSKIIFWIFFALEFNQLTHISEGWILNPTPSGVSLVTFQDGSG